MKTAYAHTAEEFDLICQEQGIATGGILSADEDLESNRSLSQWGRIARDGCKPHSSLIRQAGKLLSDSRWFSKQSRSISQHLGRKLPSTYTHMHPQVYPSIKIGRGAPHCLI
ncbi:hypothetical protein HETIRDRAFT_420965 [Heterobasidion irregulare TC 32-1]|uniref:Uncharacterized protein n=1 Tax=Heterobasidion irregulare (strain TC 32-1) TaxID=747525 RepID=W4JYK1_HETIT|nr:uncharacterized protein HETIRDRAFT_420965 [Heterobasidion irregulare TC 32-1]ETW78180.1 hypothetical protein HETIRDRAFT_420965 [Heterobasidion irregulare TC 32-1]